MDVTTILILIAAAYVILLFFDVFFKSCSHYPYIRFLKETGIVIKPFQIKWSTTAFNRLFLRWGSNLRFLNAWFTCGMYITLLFVPISVVLLLVGLSQNIYYSRHSEKPGNIIFEPMIPGVNLPGSEIAFYSLGLIVSGVVHEVGHALAMVKEDAHIINVGLDVFFVIPVAYVGLSVEKLNALNPWRALRVTCAGVWHNLILSLVAGLLYTCLPHCYSTLFTVNEGVHITALSSNSPLVGQRGLEVSDVLVKINLCTVTNEDILFQCLQQAYLDKPGYCVDADVVHNLDESVPLRYTNNGLDCCDGSKPESSCFEYIEKNDGVLEIPPHACLPARVIIESSRHTCGNNLSCPNKLHCIKPLLDNTTSLLKIERIGKPDVLFIGHPDDILRTVTVSSYIPKYRFSNVFAPDLVMKFFAYIIVISTGLAVLNTIPCLLLDGQHIMNFVVQILMKDYTIESARTVSTFISLLTTFVLIIHSIYTICLRLA